MKFTKEEISLCKQIAEKHKREVEYGIWFIWGDEVPIIASGNMKQRKDLFPLWTISDCLEFLREKEALRYQLLFDDECRKDKYQICIEDLKLFPGGQTPLEACLKAVLTMLKS